MLVLEFVFYFLFPKKKRGFFADYRTQSLRVFIFILSASSSVVCVSFGGSLGHRRPVETRFSIYK